MLKLYNTLSRKIEDFCPIRPGQASLYTCGPTVYNFAHIGNLRTYIFEDVLRRVLEYDGYKVKHAMNITDVGHLTSDGDVGEDKLEVGARREGKGPLEIAKSYEAKFFEDLQALNIQLPRQVLRATDAIEQQIEIIRLLEDKGFTYQDESAIYFDTSKFSDYGKLSGQSLADKKTGAREEVVVDSRKKNPQDFVLWFFLTGRYKAHILHWPSPWGQGFPGWHIECSAISRELLGQPFDIHTGGVDHIGTHHTNEIAQSEGAFGVPLAKVWMHGEFLLIDAGRMGKSENNFITLDTLKAKGFSPLDFRYLCLTAHYRSQLNFTWESLQAARTTLNKLYDFVRTASPPHEGELPARPAGGEGVVENLKSIATFPLLDKGQPVSFPPLAKGGLRGGIGCAGFEADFLKAINDDLNTPEALSVVWKLIGNSEYPKTAKMTSLLKFDRVLGLGLDNPPITEIPAEIKRLMQEREAARLSKDFAKSDELRKQISALGFEVEDTPSGPKLKKA